MNRLDLNQHLVDAQEQGKSLSLHNGCWISLKEDDGCFWGTNPYGVDWCCNATGDWLETVINWIEFWDAPRNEWGHLCEIGDSGDE